MKLVSLCVVVILMFEKSTSQNATDPCNIFTSCGDCIRNDNVCSWCNSYSPNSTIPRCFSSIDTVCEDREDPKGSISITENAELEGLVQVKPQHLTLKMRVGEPQSFDFTVRPSRGYPVDLYFLIDYSNSLEPFIDTLKNTTQKLADALANFTDSYTVGLGAFVDKPVKPFISTHPNLTDGPCDGCARTFSYVNLLSLTNDTARLVDALSGIQVSGNLDPPESLLDGLMQSVVCRQVIGWRNQSRHLILSISDQSFKSAGHGKYAGIMKPSDGKCHLDADNEYRSAVDFDYPSMSHLAAVLTKYQVVPLLGYTSPNQQNVQQYYTHLMEAMPGRRPLIDLSQGPSELITKLEDALQSLSEEVSIQTETFPDLDVQVELVGCPGDKIGDTCILSDSNAMVNFTATLTVQNCTEDLRQGREITINSVFFGSILVSIQAICECSCEDERSNVSEDCSSRGSLVCGQCICDNDSYGLECQCDRSGNGTNVDIECPSRDGVECSGQGKCDCGMCTCELGAYGDACECRDANCPIGTNGEQCSNSDFRCQCGECVCGDGFTRDDCSCSVEEDQCVPESGILCNDQGSCECNECKCNNDYTGQFCQVCVNPDVCQPQCSSYSACVDCYLDLVNDRVVMITGNASETCSSVCQISDRPTTVTIIPASSGATGSSLNGEVGHQCTLIVRGTNCNNIQYFIYLFDTDTGTDVVIQALQDPESCVTSVEAWVIAVPIVIGLLVLGIVILVAIKLILVLLDPEETHVALQVSEQKQKEFIAKMQDYLEYKKFLKDVKDSSAGNMINPLYTAPQQQIDNPLYEARGNEQ